MNRRRVAALLRELADEVERGGPAVETAKGDVRLDECACCDHTRGQHDRYEGFCLECLCGRFVEQS